MNKITELKWFQLPPWQMEWSNVVMLISSLKLYDPKRFGFPFLWKKGQIFISISATLRISLLPNMLPPNNVQCMYDCSVFLTVPLFFLYIHKWECFSVFSAPNDCYWHVVWYLIYDLILLLEKYLVLSAQWTQLWNFVRRVYATIILRHIINNTFNRQTPISSNGWSWFFIAVINRISCVYVSPDME